MARIDFRDGANDMITSDWAYWFDLDFDYQCDGWTYWAEIDTACGVSEANENVLASIHNSKGDTAFRTVTGAPKDVNAVRFLVFDWSNRDVEAGGPPGPPDVHALLYTDNSECLRAPDAVCTVFEDPGEAAPTIDYLAASFHLKFFFKSSTTRVPVEIGFPTIKPRGPWAPAGNLAYVDDLFVVDIGDNMRILTTENPDPLGPDADLAELTVWGEYLGTYHMPFEMTVLKVP